MMVGRTVKLEVDKAPATPGEPILLVDHLSVIDDRDQVTVDDVSFDVRAGEILAVAGVQGNGQTELTEALLGLRPAAGGSIKVDGVDLAGSTPRDVLRSGVGYIPEDRQRDGLVSEFSVADNLVLDTYAFPPFGAGLALRPQAIREAATRRAWRSSTCGPTSTSTAAGTLSGGNQQKVVLARELSRPLRLLIASQPTRGLDVGSMEFVHRRIVEARDEGTAVLIVSAELDEVLGLADRIVVMFDGRIVGVARPGRGVPGADRSDDGRRHLNRRALDGRPDMSDAPATAPARPEPTGPARRGGGLPGFGRSMWQAVIVGNSVVVTILALVLALVVSAILIAFSDPVVLPKLGSFFTAPGAAVAATWHSVAASYSALFKGAIVDPSAVSAAVQRRIHLVGLRAVVRDRRERHAADPRGAVGLPGLSRRTVQHRRPGPGDPRRDVRGLRRLRDLAAPGDPRRGRGAGGVRRRRAVGPDRRLAEGEDRCP